MTLRTIGGWALLIGALMALCTLIGTTIMVDGAALYLVAGEVSGALLIAGLPAIWAMQPHAGRLGQLGLWCLAFGVGIALLVRLFILFSAIDVDTPSFLSALFELAGSLVVGWVTIRAKVFHPAIGGLLMIGGALNLIGGLLPAGASTDLIGITSGLAQVGAFGGFGWTILRSAPVVLHAAVEQRSLGFPGKNEPL